MSDRLQQVLREAASAGVLPAGAAASETSLDHRPWPVVLLTALGAWLAALPLLGVVGLMLGDVLRQGAGLYVVGVLMLAAAVVVLRARDVPLFVEQLAVPALLTGASSLCIGLFRDLPEQSASITTACVLLALAGALPRAWLRVLLGVLPVQFLVIAFLPRQRGMDGDSYMACFWLLWQASVAVWLAALWVQRNVLDKTAPGAAAALESIAAGWVLATLVGLSWWSGMTFLVGGIAGAGLLRDAAGEVLRATHPLLWMQVVSAALAAAAAALLARSWPAMRRPWLAGVAAVLLVLSWFLPALGAVLLVLAQCAVTHRWRVAGAAALAAAWIIGGFYSQLHWLLATKAFVLVGAGAALGALAWTARRDMRGAASTPSAAGVAVPTPATRKAQAGIALCLFAVLAVANVGIWQKEDLIAHGQPVFVELAPADPRSLMQGDYMRLNFRLPGEIESRIGGLVTPKRPLIVARRDARGIATPLRLDEGAALGPDELRIELTPRNGRWILVSDAWYFKEGEGDRWIRAKYGEFRVDAGGRALLVGLRGPDLQPL